MRLLLLLFSFIFLSSSSASSLATGSGILEILIESGAPTDVGFIVTFDNDSHVTWRHLEPNIPELLIFNEFNQTHYYHTINVTIHDNVTSYSTITAALRGLYDIDYLPLPYTGLQIKFKCAENRYGWNCDQPCLDPRENWRCDKNGHHVCAEGYCGWNCHKSGSECQNECKCQNGGKCYSSPHPRDKLAICECPPGYYGDYCEKFSYCNRISKISTNFGQSTMVPNKFSNRTDIYQLFEQYEKTQRTSGYKELLTFFGPFDLLVKPAKVWIVILMVVMAGYCIYKFCVESEENEEKISSGDKKKTPDEEKKCTSIEMNDM
ncbi:hypothetical protein CRE_21493 [Caenorhabditis remanei]|uniref:Uncharacterized protein n=2 Tax=Caenorhabditis remanei TaxID=31234 RepID=E3N905_CAERE|nr:hypothetical protein CRE_21493 [Caenorhabditis remanei]